MNNTAPHYSEDSEPQRPPITEPHQHIGRGHPEYHFVQYVMELHSTIHKMDSDHKVMAAKLESKLDAIKEATDSTKKKVDELVRWKTLIIGGSIALGAVLSGMVTLYIKMGDRITIAPVHTQSAAPAAPAAPAVSAKP